MAASATSTASSHVIDVITITAPTALDFGKFIAGAAAGTVTIKNDGSRLVTGVTAVNAGSFHSAAKFSVSGGANATYTISHEGVAVLTPIGAATGSPTMALTKTSSFTADQTATTVNTGTLGADGTQDIFVGGILAVAAAQPSGVYQGEVGITVEYN